MSEPDVRMTVSHAVIPDTIFQALVGTIYEDAALWRKYEVRLTLDAGERASVLSHFQLSTERAVLLQGGDAVTTVRQNAARMLVQAEAEHRHILSTDIAVSQAAATQATLIALVCLHDHTWVRRSKKIQPVWHR